MVFEMKPATESCSRECGRRDIVSPLEGMGGERTSESSTSEHADGDRVAETIMVLGSIQVTAQAKAQPVKM